MQQLNLEVQKEVDIINENQNLKSTTQYPRRNHKKRAKATTESKMQIFQKEIL